MLSRLTLLGLHLIGNAALLWLGYRWLGMDESDGSHLWASFGCLALLIVGVAWLHGLAFAHFAGLPLHRAALRSLQCLPPLTLWFLLSLVVYGALVWVRESDSAPAFAVASFLTLHFHKAVSPGAIEKLFHAVLLVLEWGFVPAVIVSVASRVSTIGWRGFGENPLRRRSFWVFTIPVAAILLLAIWVPFKLFFWIPNLDSFNGQFASLLLRGGFGYFLFVLSILFLEFITASGKPFETQPSTAA